MLQIFLVIAPLFLIIFTAALIQRFGKVAESWERVLNDFVLHIGLPALIFSALSRATLSFSGEKDLLVANSLFLLGGFLLAAIIGKVLRLKKELFHTLFICLAFGNVAYLGIPVLTRIAGEGILPTASLIVAVYLFWMFTVGVGYLDYAQEKRKRDVIKKVAMNLVKNPLLIAVVLGLLVVGFRVPVPGVITQAISMVAASVTPVVLVVIGLFIGKSKFEDFGQWVPAFLFTLLTLFALPALFYFGVKALGHAPQSFSASIIDAAMPLAITPFALADKFHLHKNFIARAIVLSTILSVITIPFWTAVL